MKCCPKSVNQIEQLDDSSGNSSNDEYVLKAIDGPVSEKNAKISVLLDGAKVSFQIDTGASVNVIGVDAFKSIKSGPTLKFAKAKLYPYGSDEALPVLGWFMGVIETKSKICTAKIYVCDGRHTESLLGLETALELGVVKIVNAITTDLPPNLQDVITRYKSRFEGIGLLKDVKVNLKINPEIIPVANKHGRVPFHLRD